MADRAGRVERDGVNEVSFGHPGCGVTVLDFATPSGYLRRRKFNRNGEMNDQCKTPAQGQPFSDEPSGKAWNNPISRRSLLKSTGKAGAVTILALHSFRIEVVAEKPNGSANM